MTAPTILVVNADDFGQSAEVNDGVLRAHEHGIVTSTSLMVRWPAARAAVQSARRFPGLSIGLHVDLGEWRYANEAWQPVYSVTDLNHAVAVRTEIAAQLETFRELVGRQPTHLDSHQHVHRREPVRAILRELGEQLRVPVRHESAYRYVGDFYGQSELGDPMPDRLCEAHLIEIVGNLDPGRWELACHPASAPPPDSMYSSERVVELQLLTAPRVREAIVGLGVALVSFGSAG